MKDELLNEIRDHVKEYEGYSQLVYECTAGYATIGYGRNLEQRGITKEESERWHQKLNEKVTIAVKRYHQQIR